MTTSDPHRSPQGLRRVRGVGSCRMAKVPTPGAATTLVPRLVAGVSTERRTRVSGKEHIALEALRRAVTTHAGRRITAPNFPACPVVEIEQWRAVCEHELTDSGSSETRGRTFRRFRDTLVEKGLVGQIDGFAWVVPL